MLCAMRTYCKTPSPVVAACRQGGRRVKVFATLALQLVFSLLFAVRRDAEQQPMPAQQTKKRGAVIPLRVKRLS